MAWPVVAIVGKPNVGKSALFNKIVGERIAIVEDTPGITRDRIYAKAEWGGKWFSLIDTGGIEPAVANSIASEVKRQVEVAIEEAEVILFVVDGRAGLTSADEDVAALLRRSGKPVILVVNKIEKYPVPGSDLLEFYSLGLGDPIPVSAIHGQNIGDLLDTLAGELPEFSDPGYPENVIKVAVVGRPNVGKSSLVNRILGEERVIVSETPGTTRDAIDTSFRRGDQEFVIIDTAGMRRKSRIDHSIERYSVVRALAAIDRCDVVFVVVDATMGVAEQDSKIAGYAHEAGKGSCIVVNKWDLVEGAQKSTKDFETRVRAELHFLNYAPVVFTSALTGKRVPRLIDEAEKIAEERARRVPTSELNRMMDEAVLRVEPPSERGRRLKIYYVAQVATKPPAFVVFVNNTDLMHFSYVRYIENQIRKAFGFAGTPIRIIVRNKA